MDLQGAELVCIFASPYTHPNDSIDMENREIYKAIKSIADELCSDGKTFLRADLAYELKKYGVAGDSSEVGSLVYDAYCFYGNDSNISIAFVTNNARTTSSRSSATIPLHIHLKILLSGASWNTCLSDCVK